jgi:ABC-type transport system involved in multi-copper enzyme maturation permease subunit
MKFLAILRDSVREALDAKVIYALLALCAVLIVLAFSLSFQPEPGEKGLEAILKRFPGAEAVFGQPGAPVTYEAKDAELIRGSREWDGKYHFKLVATDNDFRRPGEKEDAGKDGEKSKPAPPPKFSQFRLLVLASNISETPPDQLTEKERQARDRIRAIGLRALRNMRSMTPEDAQKLNEDLGKEANNVTPEEMERFFARQFREHGSLDVTGLHYEGHQDKSYAFDVTCQARPDAIRTWPNHLVLFFGAVTWPSDFGVGHVVYFVEKYFVTQLGAGLIMLIGTVVTAFFIPNMLRKGTIDLLISKPIHRWYLLLCKYVGGLSFVVITTAVIVGGVWLALGLRSGLWSRGFLLSIPVLTLEFAVFYALSTLVGVLSRSPILAILTAVAFWFLLFLIGLALTLIRPFDEISALPKWVFTGVDTARLILPRYYDLDTLNNRVLAHDVLSDDDPWRRDVDKEAEKVSWYPSLAVTFAFIGLMLGLACWRFSVKDY